MIRTEPRVILKAAAPELRRDYGFARVTVAPDQSMLGSQMSHARIEIDPAVTGCKPVIRGTRAPLEHIVRECGRGLSASEVAEQYPRLTPEDVLEALAFAADCLNNEIIVAAE